MQTRTNYKHSCKQENGLNSNTPHSTVTYVPVTHYITALFNVFKLIWLIQCALAYLVRQCKRARLYHDDNSTLG